MASEIGIADIAHSHPNGIIYRIRELERDIFTLTHASKNEGEKTHPKLDPYNRFFYMDQPSAKHKKTSLDVSGATNACHLCRNERLFV